MFDPDDPYSGYRPEMDKYGHADHKKLTAAGWAIPFLLFCGGVVIIALVAISALSKS